MGSVLKTPVRCSIELTNEIKDTRVTAGAAIWWLGQSGYAIKTKESTIYIDLYLSESLTEKYKDKANPHNRITSSPMRGAEIFDADLILSTHKHTDHMDPQTIPAVMKNCPNAKYILPKAHIDHVLAWGLNKENLIPARVDEEIIFKDIKIIPQPARHESLDFTEENGYPHMSYIIKVGETVIYHSGDTIPYNGMIERLKKHNTTAAMLPINGRDKLRHSYGTAGNCTIEEALCIAELAGVKLLIPHHYDMFTFNTVDINEFADIAKELYPDVKCRILQCGEKSLII